jgi:phenylalanyl-tRNA synthetase beta chain
MKVSLNWLKEFVDLPADPRRLKADLTRIGLNLESYTAAGDDWVFDIEVTTNRPDCLSHYGVAREAATLYRKRLKPLSVRLRESSRKAAEEITIQIADRALSRRYCGRVILNVQVRPSPEWMRQRLEAVGIRSINNVADVTNYVLMELGHPLHAFDLARLCGKKIVVRRARAGETLRTLDGFDRVLKPENLVIADAEHAVALAGVMGGEDSEISTTTKDVLLESAWFDPVSIRRTAKIFGLHTEASHRFERGADIEMARLAIDRAAELIAQVAGGEVLRGVVDAYPGRKPSPTLTLRSSEILRILGAEVPAKHVDRLLRSLQFQVVRRNRGAWQVRPPSFRPDVTREVDLIEEVARHYGYDRLPARVRPAAPCLEPNLPRQKELALSATLVALGYREIIPPSMIDPEENARFTDRAPVPLANPLSQDASVLRSSALPSMVRALRWNLDRDQPDLRFFEMGKTYTATGRELPEERRVLVLGLTGRRRPADWRDKENERDELIDLFDLKGDLETLFRTFDASDLRFEPGGCAPYEPNQAGKFLAGDRLLAYCGRLKSGLTSEYKLRQEVWLAEADLESLMELPRRLPSFRAFSKFPAIERDFSLTVPDRVPYERLAQAVRGASIEELQTFRPVELFRGGVIPAGSYSMLFRVTFQSLERTLSGEEVAQASRRLLAALEPLGVRVRD